MPVVGNDAPILNLKDYLSRSHVKGFQQLVIPPWQRDYVWKPKPDDEVGELLADLQTFVDSNDEDYLLGSVLLSQHAQKNELLVIDGQQRSLTVMLLFMAVLKYAQEHWQTVCHSDDPEVNALENETKTLMWSAISAKVDEFIPRVSMSQMGANVVLSEIFWWAKKYNSTTNEDFLAEKDAWTQTQKNLVDVVKWIYDQKLVKDKWFPDDQLLKAMRKILHNVKVLEVTISSESEAITTFDRVNSRGAALDTGDLIKNRIFQTVSDQDFDDIKNSWSTMSENLVRASNKRLKEPKLLLRALALERQTLEKQKAKDGVDNPIQYSAPKITYHKLTDYWKEQIGNKLDPMDFAKTLESTSADLEALSNGLDPRDRRRSLRELYFSRFIGSVQHYPMLLAGRNIEDPDVFRRLVRQVHTRTAYYMLSGERNADFESLVPTWTALIAQLKPDATIEKLDHLYEEYVKVDEKQIDLLIESMAEWRYTRGGEKNKIRAVLSQLTRILDNVGKKEDKESPISYFSTKKDDNGESWDIDHIQPKKRQPQDSPVHLIGNLVLLKADHNQLAKASQPADKAQFYKDSQLLLSKCLVEIHVEKERQKVEKYWKEIGFAKPNWDLSDWGKSSTESRLELYGKMLKHHLTDLSSPPYVSAREAR